MKPTAVIDLENRGYPKGGGWSPDFDLGVVLIDATGKEKASALLSGSGIMVGAKFKAWMKMHHNPVVTSYNHSFDRRRLAESCNVTGLTWGPDIKILASDVINAANEESLLPNGFKKWPTLDEAAAYFNIPKRKDHNPLGDARLAAQVMVAILNQPKESTMPVQECEENGKPGYRYGESGACYTYEKGDEAGRKKAKQKAYLQGYAIQVSQKKAGKSTE